MEINIKKHECTEQSKIFINYVLEWAKDKEFCTKYLIKVLNYIELHDTIEPCHLRVLDQLYERYEFDWVQPHLVTVSNTPPIYVSYSDEEWEMSDEECQNNEI